MLHFSFFIYNIVMFKKFLERKKDVKSKEIDENERVKELEKEVKEYKEKLKDIEENFLDWLEQENKKAKESNAEKVENEAVDGKQEIDEILTK